MENAMKLRDVRYYTSNGSIRWVLLFYPLSNTGPAYVLQTEFVIAMPVKGLVPAADMPQTQTQTDSDKIYST